MDVLQENWCYAHANKMVTAWEWTLKTDSKMRTTALYTHPPKQTCGYLVPMNI